MKPTFGLLTIAVIAASITWGNSQAGPEPRHINDTGDNYLILESGSRDTLILEVNRGISRGYKPIGGVSVAFFGENGAGRTYAQAMGK